MSKKQQSLLKYFKPRRIIYLLGTLTIIVFFYHACSWQYAAEPIEAWVIDADTKKPIKDVIVVAHWELYGGLEGGVVKGQIMVMERVTDKNGRFYFPAWGPKRTFRGHLKFYDPQIILFKPGYHYRQLNNSLSPDRRDEVVHRSDWHGKTIEMRIFKNTINDYKINFESYNKILERIMATNPTQCLWKKIPNSIRAMNQERNRLIAQGANPHTLSSVDEELIMNDEYYTKKGGCGSPKVFFKDLK